MTANIFKNHTKIGLLPKILIAITLGIAFSFFTPVWAARVFVTASEIFSSFLGLVIPFLIIGLIASGIADLGQGGGKLLLITVLIACASTLFSGFGTYFACSWAYPDVLGSDGAELVKVDISGGLLPYFTLEMPPVMTVTSALVTSFLVGLGLSFTKGNVLRNAVTDFRDIIYFIIEKVIIPFLPIYIFCIFLRIGVEGKVSVVLGMFFKIIVVILVLHVLLLLIQFCIAGAIAGKNPLKALLTMMPAYVTALGTQSSAATIPVTLAQTARNGVREDIAAFVVPLCATIHLAGSILKIVACSYAISLCMGMPVGLDVYGGFIFMVSLTMIAAPGVPGGAIMAAIGVIGSMLGFDADLQGLMIAIYIAIDSFGTACNVTGDGAIALIVDKIGK